MSSCCFLIASAAMVEEMASHGSYDQAGGRRKLVSSIPCGRGIQDFAISVHNLQLCSGSDKDELLALLLGIYCRDDSRILHLHLQVNTPDLTPSLLFHIYLLICLLCLPAICLQWSPNQNIGGCAIWEPSPDYS